MLLFYWQARRKSSYKNVGVFIMKEMFYLENPYGVIADSSGNPPYEF